MTSGVGFSYLENNQHKRQNILAVLRMIYGWTKFKSHLIKNMNFICRTCLSNANDEMESIYSIKFISNEFISISEMIALCVGLEISKYDNFTNVICKLCTDLLIDAFLYRIKCWDSHKRLLREAAFQKSFVEKEVDVIEIQHCTKEEMFITEDENNVENAFIDKMVPINESVVAEPDKPITSDISPVILPPESQKLSDHAEIILDKTSYLGKRYNCKTCNHLFMRRDKIVAHLRLAHRIIISIPNGYSCDICFKIFEAPSTLRNHKEAVHNGISYICDLCGASLKTKVTFQHHMRIHTGEKPFKCKFCDYRSAHNGTIIAHQRRLHTGEKPLLCHICGEGFISASRRSQHLAVHSEPKYQCIVCQKQFKALSVYKKHIIIHDLSKYVPCDVCGKKFAKRSNLTTHRKQHTGEKNHTCKECGKGFIQRHCWRTHMKNHHNQNVV